MVVTGVLHLVDSLDAGGTERVAVNLVNHLSRERFRPFLATTRRDGALASAVLPDVGRLALGRTRTLERQALRRLIAFIRENGISILHAHSSSLFLAQIAAMVPPRALVVWHDHYGKKTERSAWLWGPPARRAAAVVSVNQDLARWSRDRLGVQANRVLYLPNFLAEPPNGMPVPSLPGEPGRRVVCVANFREQKSHVTLIRAFARVLEQLPEAHLLLAGAEVEPDCAARVREEAASLGSGVSFLGPRPDIPALLRGCDIGVLASSSEGFPVSLLEYGGAGLAVVATRVGQCPEVLAEGEAGVLVRPGDPAALAEALLALLRDSAQRAVLGERLGRRVRERYSAGAVMERLEALYHTILAPQEVGR